MGAKFFSLDALPVRMKKLGDNIEHLYHTGCRTVVNSVLVGHKVGGIHVQFGADEYDQIVITFINQFGAESDKIVIRARKLAKVVDTINEAYVILTNKGFTTMSKKEKKTVAETTVVSNEVSNVTSVASVNHSDFGEANILVEYILQHYSRSGNLYELAEFVNEPRLYQTKSYGAVSNIVFNGDNITIEGAISISFCVAGMNQSELREQVIWALQTVIERNKRLAEQTGDGTEHKKLVTDDKVEAQRELMGMTQVKPLRRKVNEKAVERFNETVSKGIDAIDHSLTGHSPSASSQSIRCFLKKSAHESRLKLPDTSGETLAKYLSQYNVELFHTLCASVNCKIPLFLQMSHLAQKA